MWQDNLTLYTHLNFQLWAAFSITSQEGGQVVRKRERGGLNAKMILKIKFSDMENWFIEYISK